MINRFYLKCFLFYRIVRLSEAGFQTVIATVTVKPRVFPRRRDVRFYLI